MRINTLALEGAFFRNWPL